MFPPEGLVSGLGSWEAEAGKVDLGLDICGLVYHPNEMLF